MSHPVPFPPGLLALADRYPFGVVVARENRVAIAWETQANERQVRQIWRGLSPDRAMREHAIISGVLALVDLAEDLGQPMALRVSDPAVTEALAGMLAQAPQPMVELVPSSRQALRLQQHIEDGWLAQRAAVVAVRKKLADKRARKAAKARYRARRSQRVPLVVATDASGRHNGTGPVGYALVTAEGTWDARVLPEGSINAGELQAIALASRIAARQKRQLHILTDSRYAISVLSGRRAPADHLESACRRHVLEASIGVNITISWVRGHSGIVLNETAHRLAFNAYRGASFRWAWSTTIEVGDQIAAEVHQGQFDGHDFEIDPHWSLTLRDGEMLADQVRAA